MSWCRCDDSTNYRISGEVMHRSPKTKTDYEFGTGAKTVRIRCAECGGKVAHVGSDLLVKLGVPFDEIVNGRCLSEEEQITLGVDLI